MLNGGQHGVAAGAAAFLCKKHRTTPRGVYQQHLPERRTSCSNGTSMRTT
jgi:hypothetical protein